jgi:CRISPR system Cascade subunit CasB
MSEITKDKNSGFVDYIIDLCGKSNSARAEIRRAEIKGNQQSCWRYIASFVDFEKEWQSNSFSLIAASIAKYKISKNGSNGLGRAINLAFGGDTESSPAQARLRRLLSCDDQDELFQILPRLFSIIFSKGVTSVNMADILADITKFKFNPEQVKAKWANQFYGNTGVSQ